MANKEASNCQTSSKYTISCEEYSSTELVAGDVVRSQKLYVPADGGSAVHVKLREDLG